MSTDFSLMVDGVEEFERNVTWNYSPMWWLARPDDERSFAIDNLTSEESLPILESVLKAAQEDPPAYVALEPKNKRGTHRTFMEALKAMIAAAREFPEGTWEACR